ncbi:hypothetical protein P9112_003370 [Eukaryota sp. TZLM1-RC]
MATFPSSPRRPLSVSDLSSKPKTPFLGATTARSSRVRDLGRDIPETPTQHRLNSIQARLESTAITPRTKSAVPQSARREESEERMSRTFANEEAELKQREAKDMLKYKEVQNEVEQLRTQCNRLQSEFENEEQTRRSLNSTFAKNLAIKIEERFIKVEAMITSMKRQVAESEEARIRMFQTLDQRITDISNRVDRERESRVKEVQDLLTTTQRLDNGLVRIERSLEELTIRGTENSDDQLVFQLQRDIADLRAQLDVEREQRGKDDAEKMKMINEGIDFIRDGKETWLRMFDYKMMPIKLAREEEEAKAKKRAQEMEAKFNQMSQQILQLTTQLEDERKVRDAEMGEIKEYVETEARIREKTEQQMTHILEDFSSKFGDN